MTAESSPDRQLRITNQIAIAWGGLALTAVLLSVFVMASRPWGCSAGNESTTVVCDWVTSRVIAVIWLTGGVAVCAISLKRRWLPLAVISLPMLAVSLISFFGVFALAPAAFWLASAFWGWAHGRRSSMVVSAVASVVLLYLAATGVIALLALHSAPI